MKYAVVLKKGENLEGFEGELRASSGVGFVPSRSCSVESVSGSRVMYVDLTKEEAEALAGDPRIQDLQVQDERIRAVPLGDISGLKRNVIPRVETKMMNSWQVVPMIKHDVIYTKDPEHASSVNVQEVDSGATVSGIPEGTGVDVVIVDGDLNPNNPELKNSSGQSRFKFVNWTGSYQNIWGDNGDDAHGQHVSGTACGFMQGWAKNSDVYSINPYVSQQQYVERMTALKNWHLAKTNGNPTITNHSYGWSYYLDPWQGDPRLVNFIEIGGQTINAPREDSGAVAQATIDDGYLESITVTSGGSGYTNPPDISFYGGGYDEAVPVMGDGSVFRITVTNPGSGYDDENPPLVTFEPSPGVTATAKCRVVEGKIFEVIMTNRGSGYSSPPIMTFSPPASGTQAVGTVEIDSGFVSSINLTNGGTGHDENFEFPFMIASGGGCTKDLEWGFSPTGKQKAMGSYVVGKFDGYSDTIDPGDFILEYNPSNGNLSLVFTGTGNSGAGPVSLYELNILTLGDGSIGPPMPSDIPNVSAGQGGLNGSKATLPSASFQTFNDQSAGLNGIFSQIFSANLGTPWITFTKANPGVSDVLNFGNVAASGWSQSNINSIFVTDPELYFPKFDGDLNFGKFAYTTGDGDARVGSVILSGSGTGSQDDEDALLGWTFFEDNHSSDVIWPRLMNATKTHGGSLYVAGYFGDMDGTEVTGLAKYDGTSWNSIGRIKCSTCCDWADIYGYCPGFLWDIQFDSQGNMYVGGIFDSADGVSTKNIAKFDGTSWQALGNGLYKSSEYVFLQGEVFTIALDSSGSVYAGGLFDFAGNLSAKNIAKYQNGSWQSIGDADGTVYDLVVDSSGTLYACGRFRSIGGVPAPTGVAKYQGGVWTSLGNEIQGGNAWGMALDGSGNLYVGGGFTSISGVAAKKVVKYSGGVWSALGDGITGFVYELRCDSSGALYVGGDFYRAGSVLVENLAKYSNGVWYEVGNLSSEIVHSIHLDENDQLYVAGLIKRKGQFVGKGVMPQDMFQILDKKETFPDGSFSQKSLGGKFSGTPLISFRYQFMSGPEGEAVVSDGQVVEITGLTVGSLETSYTSPPNVVFTNGGGFTKEQLEYYGIGDMEQIPVRVAAVDSVIEDLIDSGVVVVAAGGNSSFRMENKDSPGYSDAFGIRIRYNYLSNPSILSDESEIWNYQFAQGMSPGSWMPSASSSSSSGAGVICVGAMGHECCPEARAVFSNFGSRIDVYAAGQEIISSVNFSEAGYSVPHPLDPSTYLTKYSGTSMASPQVAGALACHAQNNRDINQESALEWLRQNARSALDVGGNLNPGTNKILFYPGASVSLTD